MAEQNAQVDSTQQADEPATTLSTKRISKKKKSRTSGEENIDPSSPAVSNLAARFALTTLDATPEQEETDPNVSLQPYW
jgi:hypothetical protein